MTGNFGYTVYHDACRAGDTAAHLASVSDHDLRRISAYARQMQQDNACKGGIPAILKWACVIEAADRFLRITP